MTNTEANSQWVEYLRYCARQSRVGWLEEGDGVGGAWINVAFSFNNAMFLTRPVDDSADLTRRIGSARDMAAHHAHKWLFFVFEPWLPQELRPEADRIFGAAGLPRLLQITAMAASKLLPPRRPLPDLEVRRIRGLELQHTAMEIQAKGYGIPVEPLYEIVAVGAGWNESEEHIEFGYVGYHRGEPVTTADVIALDSRLYVALVATDPRFQRRGYAEAIMRYALAEAAAATGVTRSDLHASAAGYPLYQAMGYETGPRFIAYGNF